MKIRAEALASILVLTLAGTAPLAHGEDEPVARLNHDEQAELIRLLDESLDGLMERVTGLTDEQWNFKQNPDRWSVAECMEHIVRSETKLLEYAENAMAGAPDPEWFERTKSKDDLLRRVMPNRNPGGVGGAQAPMEIRPTEHWDRAKAIEEFYKIRGKVRGYADTLHGDIKAHTFEHPFPVFNWLNAHDWLLYIPLHTIRHTRQLIEVQEDPNYPKAPAE